MTAGQLGVQVIEMLLIAIPIASISWTITHEEVFREPREYCIRQSESHPNPVCRKFFFLFTCEFCFSHYVTAFFLIITRYKLLFDDWQISGTTSYASGKPKGVSASFSCASATVLRAQPFEPTQRDPTR